MKMNRLLCSAFLMLTCWATSSAQQRLDILLGNNDVISTTLDNIKYMEIVEGAGPNELDGYWFLGWKVTSNGSGTKTHYNATEMLVFTAGPTMKWVKSNGETIYDVAYSDGGAVGGATLTATRQNSSTKSSFQILIYEDDFLILRQSTTRYYFYRTREAATNATDFVTYPTRTIYTDPAKLWAASLKGGSTASNLTPMGKHFESYRAATDEDKEWLANPSNQPDAAWLNVGGYSYWTAKTITLYPFGSPVPADVNQHAIGNCCMCAVFASFAYIYPDWIKSIIEKSGNNYTVHMFDPKGNPVDVVVDNKLLCNGSSSTAGCAQVSGKNDKFNWATIMEKALMKWETRFRCNNIGGIGTEYAAPPFTGNGASYSFSSGDYLFNSEYSLIVEYALSHGMISVGGFRVGGVWCGPLETVTGHAFTVMYPDEGADYLFVMRNPWGNGGYPIDGKLEIPNKHDVLRLVDFRLVFPGAQMAQYMRQDLGSYTAPRFRPTPRDMNPTEEMLRMYGVTNYVPFPLPEDALLETEGE